MLIVQMRITHVRRRLDEFVLYAQTSSIDSRCYYYSTDSKYPLIDQVKSWSAQPKKTL